MAKIKTSHKYVLHHGREMAELVEFVYVFGREWPAAIIIKSKINGEIKTFDLQER